MVYGGVLLASQCGWYLLFTLSSSLFLGESLGGYTEFDWSILTGINVLLGLVIHYYTRTYLQLIADKIKDLYI
jgi:hypothetical protein